MSRGVNRKPHCLAAQNAFPARRFVDRAPPPGKVRGPCSLPCSCSSLWTRPRPSRDRSPPSGPSRPTPSACSSSGTDRPCRTSSPRPKLPPEELDHLTPLGRTQTERAAALLREQRVRLVLSSPAGTGARDRRDPPEGASPPTKRPWSLASGPWKWAALLGVSPSDGTNARPSGRRGAIRNLRAGNHSSRWPVV